VLSLTARLTALEEQFLQRDGNTAPDPHQANQTPRGTVQDVLTTSNRPSAVDEHHSHPQGVSTSEVPIATATTLKEPWSAVVKKPRRAKREQKRVHTAAKRLLVVLGTGDNDCVKSCKPLKDVFVCVVDSSCCNDAIKQHIIKKGVLPKRVQRVSKDIWFQASFRITVEEAIAQKVLQAEFWPDGVKCREWLRTVPKTGDDSATHKNGDTHSE